MGNGFFSLILRLQYRPDHLLFVPIGNPPRPDYWIRETTASNAVLRDGRYEEHVYFLIDRSQARPPRGVTFPWYTVALCRESCSHSVVFTDHCVRDVICCCILSEANYISGCPILVEEALS